LVAMAQRVTGRAADGVDEDETGGYQAFEDQEEETRNAEVRIGALFSRPRQEEPDQRPHRDEACFDPQGRLPLRLPRPRQREDYEEPVGNVDQLARALAGLVPQIVVPNDPGPYEGGQDFPRWKKFVLRSQKTNNWTRAQLISRMGQFLDGPAWLTFERMRDRDELPDSVEELLDAIGRKHCDLKGSVRDALHKFRMRKQRAGETVYQFLATFEALASECGASEDLKMRTLIENISPEASDALTRCGAETWVELRSAAVREQQVMDNRRARTAQVANLRREWEQESEEYEVALAAVNAVQQCQGQWFQRGSGYDGYRRGEQGSGPDRQETHRDDRRVEEKLDQMMELMKQLLGGRGGQNVRRGGGGVQERRCFRCDGAGHFARECPQPGNARGARMDVQSQAPTK
jgi:hypothetical protein